MGDKIQDAFEGASSALIAGEPSRARQLLAPIVRTDPMCYRAWLLLVEVEIGLGDAESAQVCAENALVAVQEAIGGAEQMVAHRASLRTVEALQALWPFVVTCRAWNPRIEVPFWEVYGDALIDLDQSLRAETCFSRVLHLRRHFMRQDETGLGGTWQRLWASAFQRNRNDAARRRIRHALRRFRIGGANDLTLGNAYSSLATLEAESANRQAAADAFAAAMTCYTKPETDELRAYMLAKRARFHLQERDYALALADFEGALAIARRIGGRTLFDVALDAAHYDHQLGEYLGDRPHLEAALARIKEAEATGMTSGKAQALRGAVAMVMGDLEEARRHLLTAFRTYGAFEAPDVLSQAYVVWHVAGTLGAAGKPSRALRLVQWAMRRLEKIYGRYHPSYLSQKLTESAMRHRLGDAEGARLALREVIDAEQAVLKRVMRRDLPLEFAAHQRIGVEAFQAYAGLTLSNGRADGPAEILSALLATAGAARSTLAAAAHAWEAPYSGPAPDLPAGVTLLAFIKVHTPVAAAEPKAWSIGWGKARIYCVGCWDGTAAWVRDLGDAERVETGLLKLREAAKSGKRYSIPASIARMFKTAVSHASSGGLIVLQSGLPAGIPFSLCAPERQLVEIESNWEGGELHEASGPDLLVVGSEFVRVAGEKIAGPGYILEEIKAVRRPSDAVLLGDNASQASVVAELAKRPRRAHLVAHGYGLTGRGGLTAFREAGIALPVQGVPGKLAAQDIAALDLHGVQLVVLSACSTGIGRTLEGEGVASLASAFLQAGTQAVLAALWPVGNVEASTFMRFFYGELDRHPPAAALKIAQDVARARGLSTRDWAGWRLFARNAGAALAMFGPPAEDAD